MCTLTRTCWPYLQCFHRAKQQVLQTELHESCARSHVRVCPTCNDSTAESGVAIVMCPASASPFSSKQLPYRAASAAPAASSPDFCDNNRQELSSASCSNPSMLSTTPTACEAALGWCVFAGACRPAVAIGTGARTLAALGKMLFAPDADSTAAARSASGGGGQLAVRCSSRCSSRLPTACLQDAAAAASDSCGSTCSSRPEWTAMQRTLGRNTQCWSCGRP
jgi:hypothetical protein